VMLQCHDRSKSARSSREQLQQSSSLPLPPDREADVALP
jgi:hypothetical protein